MNRFVLPAAALAALGLSAGCAYQQGASANGQQRSPRAATELARELTGKIAGPRQSCLSTLSAGDMTVIDDYTILYRHGSTTYRNDPPGGCPGLGRSGTTMVSRLFGSQLCRGDIVHLVNLPTGISGGSCVLGDFVPFTKPGR